MAQPFKEKIIFRGSSSSSSSSSAIQKTNNLQGLLLLPPPPPPPPPSPPPPPPPPSSSSSSWKYDVFLSFRGQDTRDNFTDHLNTYLRQNGIKTFRDDSLTRGEEISLALLEAIEGSMISIIVFSENYASSKWCLDELVHILKCKKSKQQRVIPVFYKVEPTDVRNQSGSFHQALANHEVQLQDNMDKVQRWRSALTTAAEISGWTYSNGYESIFIHNIIKGIVLIKEISNSQLVSCPAISDGPNLVGLGSRVKEIIELVDLSTPKTRYVGIWGPVGIGKTTVAREVYKSMSDKFEATFFLEDIAQKSQQGSLDQQKTLLTSALTGKSKVLLILDNVTKLNQLDLLIKSMWFSCESRIIITTRDRRLLTDYYKVDAIYKLMELDDPDAFELFRANIAFQRGELPVHFKKLEEVAVRYSQGFPLVLTVLGKYLGNATEEEDWQQVLSGESKDLPRELYKKFMTSYNELPENEKKVFLDIACFLKGETKDHVIQILPYTNIEIKNNIELLEDRALMNVKADGCISMYNWLQDMGKETARRESADPEQRTRLCSHNEVSDVLTNETGSAKIKGILVKFPKPNQVVFSASSFSGMKGLEIFVNNNGQFKENINYLPDKLRLIEWPQFPFKSLPSTFVPKELVKLNMPDSGMSQLGTGFKSSRSLKYINLESCQNLQEIPNFSGFENLRDLNLDYCTGLVEIDDSVGDLKKLAELSLSGCESLVKFPSSINLKSVKFINFKGCTRLETLPEIMGEMKFLKWLDLSGTGIKELPSSIRNLISLLQLLLLGCERLEKIPELPPTVEFVNAADCIQLERYAELSNIMEHGRSQMIKRITLFNCKKLCESLVRNMAEIRQIPSPVSLCSLFLFGWKSGYEVVFPESRVPQWFSHSKDVNQLTEKSEFSIPIPSNFKLKNRGLAICAAAAAVGRTNPEEPSSCSFTARISINEGGTIVTRCFSFEGKDMESVHVWLCYIPFVTFAYRESQPFTCRVSLEQESKGSLRCKSYGVHLVE